MDATSALQQHGTCNLIYATDVIWLVKIGPDVLLCSYLLKKTVVQGDSLRSFV